MRDLNFEQLKALAETLKPVGPEIWPSRFMPPGKAFEMDMEDLHAPVLFIDPISGRTVRETRRVLVVNADDLRAAGDRRAEGET